MRYVLKELGRSQEEKKLEELAKVCNVYLCMYVCAHIKVICAMY
jgi:hypothetical protein